MTPMFAAFVSGILSGLIAGGGTLLASVADKGSVSELTWLIAGVTAIVAFAKDVQSRMSEPPKA